MNDWRVFYVLIDRLRLILAKRNYYSLLIVNHPKYEIEL